MKLYVIGNGFDLWHDVPTRYSQFYEFAKETLDEIEDYYSCGMMQSAPWHDFESSLGTFNWREFLIFITIQMYVQKALSVAMCKFGR